MIVALAFCQRDQELTLKLAQWIEELGGAKAHKLLLCHDARCPENVVQPILERFQASFERVLVQVAKAAIDGWPAGANYMFRTCCDRIKVAPFGEFLWLEPDAVPLKEGWLDAIESEYKKAGKPFMGDRVQVKDVPLHMSGVGVYQNPIFVNAGEAYRAHDLAWDMAAAHQIVPNAHWTPLIEHAWKHPSFTNLDELNTQIRPEAVLFHSSKDGSLIDLLRKKKGGDATCPLPESRVSNAAPTVQPAGAAGISCDIFIRTYPKDYAWLAYCLKSIDKFATGFRKIVVVSTEPLPAPTEVEWIVKNEETKDGYLAQQIHKLYADVITDYQADYILHIDSDVIFTHPVTPADFFVDGKIQWLYTPYDQVKGPWKPITEKFMGRTVEFEFMRRFPLMIPKWLYPKLREFCHQKHDQILSHYVAAQPHREFSEFNALGAYAYYYHRDKFSWLNTTESLTPNMVARQFFSWGGVTEEVKKEIETILNPVPVLADQSLAVASDVVQDQGEARESTQAAVNADGYNSRGGVQNTVNGVDGSDSGFPEPGAITTMPLQTPEWSAATPRGEILAQIQYLKHYANQSVGNRIFVMQRLGRAGLKSKYKRKKKKRARAHSGNVG